MIVVGLAGRAGSGKDSAADVFVEYGFQKISFAQAVKDAVYTLSPYIFYDGYWQRLAEVVDYEGWDKLKRSNKEARRLLQRLGAEVGRQLLGEDIWINIVKSKIEQSNKTSFVIPDLRYENEAKFIKSFPDSLTIRIERPNLEETSTHHSSENIDFVCDRIYKNKGSLADWQESIAKAIESRFRIYP